jgi:hypothetical protein
VPDVSPGDIIRQKAGKRYSELKVLEVHFREGAVLGMSHHRDMLTLTVENVTANQFRTPRHGGGVSIGAINAGAVVVGDGNVQNNVNMTLQSLVQQLAKTGDAEAKGLLAKFFGNPTVSSILGSAAAELLKKAVGG